MARYIWNEDLQSIVVDPNSFANRSKWVCFACKKSHVRVQHNESSDVLCPSCRQPTVDMGYLFQAPPKRNSRLWRVMKLLGQYGYKYSTAGRVADSQYHFPSTTAWLPHKNH